MKQCSAVHDRDFATVYELFPINSDSVPKEEKQKQHEVLSTYAKRVLNGPRDLSSPKGVHLTTDMSSAQPVQAPPCQLSPFPKEWKKYFTKREKCWNHNSRATQICLVLPI